MTIEDHYLKVSSIQFHFIALQLPYKVQGTILGPFFFLTLLEV